MGKARAVVTVAASATSEEAKYAASAMKTGPVCGTGLTSGRRAALEVLKLAATLVPGAAVDALPETVSCAWAAHAVTHSKNDDSNSLFMISP